MGRRKFRPGNMLYPVPAVLVSVADRAGRANLFTVAWAGTICSDPPMVSISVRPERHSYQMIKETGEFVINLTTESMAWATDYCGVRSGRDTDKWAKARLTREPAFLVTPPLVKESPVCLECRVTEVRELGSHHMFLAEIVSVDVDERYIDEKDAFHLSEAKPLAYSHGWYYGLGARLGRFGYSVSKEKKIGGKAPGQGKTGGRAPAMTKTGPGHAEQGKPGGKPALGKAPGKTRRARARKESG